MDHYQNALQKLEENPSEAHPEFPCYDATSQRMMKELQDEGTIGLADEIYVIAGELYEETKAGTCSIIFCDLC